MVTFIQAFYFIEYIIHKNRKLMAREINSTISTGKMLLLTNVKVVINYHVSREE